MLLTKWRYYSKKLDNANIGFISITSGLVKFVAKIYYSQIGSDDDKVNIFIKETAKFIKIG